MNMGWCPPPVYLVLAALVVVPCLGCGDPDSVISNQLLLEEKFRSTTSAAKSSFRTTRTGMASPSERKSSLTER